MKQHSGLIPQSPPPRTQTPVFEIDDRNYNNNQSKQTKICSAFDLMPKFSQQYKHNNNFSMNILPQQIKRPSIICQTGINIHDQDAKNNSVSNYTNMLKDYKSRKKSVKSSSPPINLRYANIDNPKAQQQQQQQKQQQEYKFFNFYQNQPNQQENSGTIENDEDQEELNKSQKKILSQNLVPAPNFFNKVKQQLQNKQTNNQLQAIKKKKIKNQYFHCDKARIEGLQKYVQTNITNSSPKVEQHMIAEQKKSRIHETSNSPQGRETKLGYLIDFLKDLQKKNKITSKDYYKYYQNDQQLHPQGMEQKKSPSKNNSPNKTKTNNGHQKRSSNRSTLYEFLRQMRSNNQIIKQQSPPAMKQYKQQSIATKHSRNLSPLTDNNSTNIFIESSTPVVSHPIPSPKKNQSPMVKHQRNLEQNQQHQKYNRQNLFSQQMKQQQCQYKFQQQMRRQQQQKQQQQQQQQQPQQPRISSKQRSPPALTPLLQQQQVYNINGGKGGINLSINNNITNIHIANMNNLSQKQKFDIRARRGASLDITKIQYTQIPQPTTPKVTISSQSSSTPHIKDFYKIQNERRKSTSKGCSDIRPILEPQVLEQIGDDIDSTRVNKNRELFKQNIQQNPKTLQKSPQQTNKNSIPLNCYSMIHSRKNLPSPAPPPNNNRQNSPPILLHKPYQHQQSPSSSLTPVLLNQYTSGNQSSSSSSNPNTSLSTAANTTNKNISQTKTVFHQNGIIQQRQKMIKFISLYIQRHKQLPPTTIDYYKVNKLIGKGAFGKVTLATHKLTGKLVAIKTIDKSFMKDEFSRRKVMQEVYILKKVRHPNVIRLLEVFQSQKHFLMVMQYASQGDLLQFVKKRKRLSEPIAKFIFKQIVYGLAHIHARSVLHRDIKLDNILIDSNNVIKICDFGVSKIVKRGVVINEQCGTPAYIAPQIISEQGYEGYFVDIWSLGVLLYAMLCGTVPFKAPSMEQLHEMIKSGQFDFPVPISISSQKIINGMLMVNPRDRMNFADILGSNWLKDCAFGRGLQEDSENSLRKSVKKLGVIKQIGKGTGNINELDIENIFYNGEKCENKLSAGDYVGIFQSESQEIIEAETLKIVESLGYPRELVQNHLKNGDINHATATYYLLKNH